jgi:hypothetical protein
MQDFPPNSHRAKEAAAEEPKRVERVTSGEAVRRKRGLGKQFKGVFINGDAKSALNYMAVEVIVPAARDTLIDALQGGIEKLIYGDTKPKRHSGAMSGYASLGHVNYQRMGASGRHVCALADICWTFPNPSPSIKADELGLWNGGLLRQWREASEEARRVSGQDPPQDGRISAHGGTGGQVTQGHRQDRVVGAGVGLHPQPAHEGAWAIKDHG